MRTLYLECNMGAAGDMLAASLLELMEDREGTLAELNQMGIPGVTFSAEDVMRCGIMGTKLHILVNGEEEMPHTQEHLHDHHEHDHHDHDHHHDHHDHDHHDHHHAHHHVHRGMKEIMEIVNDLSVSDTVKADVKQVYSLIAEAESKAHGREVSVIHFHEVGTMDAIADITAVCFLLEQLAPEKILSSPVTVGSGTVKCAHGILPVPAPATAHILQGIPTKAGEIEAELCTPTGAALLRHFASDFVSMPLMKTEKIGYGAGTKDFPQANFVRAFLGETKEKSEEILTMACNLDDMTAEEISFACEQLLAAGALDVFTTAIGMKKNRPGTLLTVLSKTEDKEKLLHEIFRHTTTLGVRVQVNERFTLEREMYVKQTELGKVRYKRSTGFGVVREKAEYDDLAEIARKTGKSIREVKAHQS